MFNIIQKSTRFATFIIIGIPLWLFSSAIWYSCCFPLWVLISILGADNEKIFYESLKESLIIPFKIFKELYRGI